MYKYELNKIKYLNFYKICILKPEGGKGGTDKKLLVFYILSLKDVCLLD